MAIIACAETHLHFWFRVSFSLLCGLSFAVAAHAQTATYRLHREATQGTNTVIFNGVTARQPTV